MQKYNENIDDFIFLFAYEPGIFLKGIILFHPQNDLSGVCCYENIAHYGVKFSNFDAW